MRIAVRYQSRGGNTKAIAEAIADVAGVKAELIDIPLNESVDVLFVGGGVYKWDIDSSLKNYLQTLDPQIVKSLVPFSTAGGMDGAKKIAAVAKAKGINVFKKALPIKVGVSNHAALGGKGYLTLNDKQIRLVEDFVKKILS
jgi:flavodoxin